MRPRMPDYLKRLPLLLSLTGCAIGIAQGSAGLDEYLYPNDDLGAVYSPQATTIKLWAPPAKAVNIALFAAATNSAFSLVPMSCDNGGVWSATLEGNQDGKYYLYESTRQEPGADKPTTCRVNDPYARGCSANTGRTLMETGRLGS